MKKKPKAFNPFRDQCVPEYSINKSANDDEMLFDQSRDFSDLTAIINEQNKSKDDSQDLLKPPKTELKSVKRSMISFGNYKASDQDTLRKKKESNNEPSENNPISFGNG